MEKRAVIYLRVSDPSQIENNSLETQLKACTFYAENNGYKVVKVFREEGVSAKHVHTRPEMRKLFEYCTLKKNKVAAVIVYKMDRWSRNVEEGLVAISLLARYGTVVLPATEVTEQNPIGKAIRTILMAVGEMDNETKGLRVKDNMQESFRKGLWPFKAPIGYRRKFRTKEENKGHEVIPDQNLAPIISRMFDNAAKGIYTKAQLARMMNDEGFGDYYHTHADHKVVRNILEKSFYYGRSYAPKWKEYAEGRHTPITDEKTWQKAYHYLILKKKNFVYQAVEQYPLKGALRCDYCLSIMTTSPSRGGAGIVNYYECKNKKCRKLRINSKMAHEQFMEILQQLQPTERVIKLFQHMVFAEWDKVINKAAEDAERLEDRIQKLRDELKSIRKAKDDGIYTAEQAREEAERVQQDLLLLNLEKSDIRIEQYDTQAVKHFTSRFLEDLTFLWNNLDLPKRQAFLEKAFNGSLICGRDKKIRTDGLAPSFKLIEALKSADGKNVTPREVESRLPE